MGTPQRQYRLIPSLMKCHHWAEDDNLLYTVTRGASGNLRGTAEDFGKDFSFCFFSRRDCPWCMYLKLQWDRVSKDGDWTRALGTHPYPCRFHSPIMLFVATAQNHRRYNDVLIGGVLELFGSHGCPLLKPRKSFFWSFYTLSSFVCFNDLCEITDRQEAWGPIIAYRESSTFVSYIFIPFNLSFIINAKKSSTLAGADVLDPRAVCHGS